MTRFGLAIGVVIILVAAVVFGFRNAAREAKREAARGAGENLRSASPTKNRMTAVGSAPVSAVFAQHVRRIDPTTRQAMLAQIRAARSRREAIETGAPNAPHELTKDYIRDRVRELVPLVRECYERALVDDPRLAGKLTVELTLGGEPEVGGVVEDSVVDGEHSTITNPNMIECVRETMHGLSFDPPAAGGRVVVLYPFIFDTAGN